MIYRYIQPSAHLREYIRDYVLAHLVMSSNKTIPLKPFPAKPEEGFTFYIRGSLLATNAYTGVTEKRARTCIVG